MSILTVIAAALSLLWLYLGIITISNNYRNRINILFSILCFAMLLWNASGGIAYSISDITVFRWASRISFIGFFLFFPLNLHFYLTASGIPARTAYLILNYLSAAVLSVCQFGTSFMFRDFIKHNGEWTGLINYGSAWTYLLIAYFIVHSALSCAVLLKWRAATDSRKEKIYSAYMLVFFNVANLTTVTLILLLPVFGIYGLQFAGFALFNVYVLCLFFLVSKLRFLNLNSSLSSDEILSNMNQTVFVLDRQLRITECSRSAPVPSLCSAGSLKKRLFTGLITDSRALSGGIDSLLEGGIRDFSAVVQYITPTGSVPSDLSCSVIRDRFGDISGFLIVSQELRTLDTFRKTYMVTGRELEVTSLVISGATYREISERLGISERTVERHLTNIYNKLGINNKIELYRMAEEYNIRM